MSNVASQTTDGQPVTATAADERSTPPATGLRALERVNPFPGMRIDVDTWRDAHDYHRAHARLHHRALHGPGIAFGLEVIPGGSTNALLIQPGVAIDRAGNLIVVDQQQVHRIEARSRCVIYLALRYRDAPVAPLANAAGPPTRVLESFHIEERMLAPTDNELELVRIDFDPQGAIRLALDPEQAGHNELDYRGRIHPGGVTAPTVFVPAPPASATDGQLNVVYARLDEMTRQVQTLWDRASAEERPPAPPAPADTVPARSIDDFRDRFEGIDRRMLQLDEALERLARAREDTERATRAEVRELRLVLGRHSSVGWDQHRDGLRRLARELTSIANVPARVLEPVDLSGVDQVDVLYLTGSARLELGDRELQGLARVLDGGGVVLAEGCAAGPRGEEGAKDFAFSFVDLGQRFGRRLVRVQRDNPLLQAHYVFADAPPGARPARLMEDNGMVCSDADYGCAWDGGAHERPLPRATIRDALEFGTNLATYRQVRV